LLDNRTSFIAKFFAVLTLGYILNPIDLIPDFVPVLGLLDDLLLVPLLIKLTLAFIPKGLIEEIKLKIDTYQKLPRKWYFAIPIIIIYLIFLVVALKYFKVLNF
jgi:uncharacterized membrane protein YkvA (DUF1232 family)